MPVYACYICGNLAHKRCEHPDCGDPVCVEHSTIVGPHEIVCQKHIGDWNQQYDNLQQELAL